MGLSDAQPCIVCTVQRRIVRAEPITKSYEIHTFECPKCGSQVRLVQRTIRKSKPRHAVIRIPGFSC
jgi:hypothetical protein